MFLQWIGECYYGDFLRLKDYFILGRKCKLQWILKDQEYDREEEVLERYYPLENTN